MLVRIRWTHMQGGRPHLQNVALATSALLTPAALIAFSICFWSIASELQWTSAFFISSGIFSHWQVWLVTAGILLLIRRLLNRWAKSEIGLRDDVWF